ncbi:MAG: Ig-like domain-containing protein [Bacteroidales bacterium]|nr:Ig-like domain-containing protein [Bacteroidales bacterium]
MKKILDYIVLIFIALIINGCANAVSPTGGPKDEIPPVVLGTSPDNFSKNFSDKTINVTFDEFVTLDNANKNILISPPQKKSPTYRLNGKTLQIRFEEDLKPETTYSINFGNAIKDLHEGNILKDYVFVFSTGENLDTLSLAGKAVSAQTLKPAEDFFVFLYSDDNDTVKLDSLPYCIVPNYMTKTNKKGEFAFSGLAGKEYLLFAIKDVNSNMLFDLPNEEIGYYPEMVKPQYIPVNQFVIDTAIKDSVVMKPAPFDTTKYNLNTFVEEDSIQKLLKKETLDDGVLRFTFRYPADNVSIEPKDELPDSIKIMKVFSAKKDTVSWFVTPEIDSLWICINYDTIIKDTTHYSLKMRKAVKPNKRKKDEEEVVVKRLNIKNNASGNKLKPEQQLILSFNDPIVDVAMRDTMWFITTKDTIYNDLHFTKIDEYGFQYKVEKSFKPEEKYQIIIPDSVFFGFRGLTNDTLKLGFSVPELAQYGNIYLTVEVPENVPQIIVDLLDTKDKIIDKQIITETQEVAFEYLEAGKYKLRATYDMDANGEWSPGSFRRKIQPEKIVFYKTELDVKANWDIDLDEPWEL